MPQAQPRPITCARPTFASGTWRSPASPRRCVDDLVDVGDAGRAERVALREEAARDVHGDPAAERRLRPRR